MRPDAPLKLSASAIRTYRECPYRYAKDYVDRLPRQEREQVSEFAFGNAVHAALAAFIRKGGREKQTVDDLIALLMRHWDSSAYSDSENNLTAFRNGRKMLENFYMHPYPAIVRQELGVERYVAWKQAHKGIIATGKLDRICMVPDGILEVVDYKTGAFRLKPELLQTDLQSIFYRTLAADHFKDLDYQSIRITFYYLRSAHAVSVDLSLQDFLSGWKVVDGAAVRIRESLQKRHEGLPLWEAFPLNKGSRCSRCPMRRHCEGLTREAAS